jgi:hypothetical protein
MKKLSEIEKQLWGSIGNKKVDMKDDPVLAGGLQGQRGYALDQQDPGW